MLVIWSTEDKEGEVDALGLLKTEDAWRENGNKRQVKAIHLSISIQNAICTGTRKKMRKDNLPVLDFSIMDKKNPMIQMSGVCRNMTMLRHKISFTSQVWSKNPSAAATRPYGISMKSPGQMWYRKYTLEVSMIRTRISQWIKRRWIIGLVANTYNSTSKEC